MDITSWRSGHVKLIWWHSARKNRDNSLIWGDGKQFMSGAIHFRRDTPVKNAMGYTLIMKGVAEIHDE